MLVSDMKGICKPLGIRILSLQKELLKLTNKHTKKIFAKKIKKYYLNKHLSNIGKNESSKSQYNSDRSLDHSPTIGYDHPSLRKSTT